MNILNLIKNIFRFVTNIINQTKVLRTVEQSTVIKMNIHF
jgi:hypothetical protein